MLNPSSKNLFIIILSGTFILFVPCFTFCQKGINSDVNERIAIRFQDIAQEKEVPSSKIEELFQDHLGFIWMGTPNGLIKYDGYEFQSYNYMAKDRKEDPTSSFTVSVNAITEDSDGNLWVGCMDQGLALPKLFRFDRNSERLIPYLFDWEMEKPLISGSVKQLLISKGTLWILSDDVYKIPLKEIYKANNNHLQVFKNDAWRSGFNRLFEDPDGQIWVTGLKGVSQWKEETGSFHFYPLQDENANPIEDVTGIYYLLQSKEEWYWAFGFNQARIFRFYPETGRFQALKKDIQHNPMYVISTSSNQIWMGTRNGDGYIQIFDPESIHVMDVKVQIEGQLFGMSKRVSSMLEDFAGNIWIGTDGGPLLKYNPQRAHFNWLRFQPNSDNSLKNNSITSIDQGQNGIYWITTFGGGLHQWDQNQDTIIHYSSKFELWDKDQMKRLLGLEVTRDGKVWFGLEYFSVGCLDPFRQTVTTYQPNMGSIHSVYQDAQDRLWFGTYRGLLLFDAESNSFSKVSMNADKKTFPAFPPVGGIFQDSQGKLWLGCINENLVNLGGVFRHDPESGRTQVFDLPEAHSFAEDQHGNIWIASQNGLYRYELKTGKFKRYDQQDGLPNNILSSVLQDDSGRLWMTTRSGISCFDPEEETFRNYFQTEGIPGKNFHFMGGYKNQAGELFFPGYFGLLYFHPDSIKINSVAPKIAFTGIDLLGMPLSIGEGSPLKQHISVTEKIRFAHQQNDLAFHYAGLHFKNPEKNQYQVKLEPYEKEWQSVGNQRFANYTNLDPGRYTFYVKTANSDGIWNEEPAALDIIIYPPWYWNIWAWSIYIVVIGLLSYWVYRFQLNRRLALAEAKRLTDLDDLKTKLYTNITHEFRTPLTVIKGITDQIAGHDKEKKLIQRNSDQLLDLINRLLELSRHEAGQLKLNNIQADILPFLRYVTESFHSYAINQKINLNFYSDDALIIMDFDREKILRILSNLISNALKFTPEYGKVQITAKRKQGQTPQQQASEYIEIQVKDTGIGIAADQLPYIFDRFYQADATPTRRAEGTGIGLALTKGLVEEMQGSISVSSKEGVGSVFIILLPITNQAPREEAFRGEDISFSPQSVPENEATDTEERIPALAVQESDQPLLLIVEDNADVLHYLSNCLQGSFQLIYARNGQQGIDQAIQQIPDIIISDIMMPEVDGLELCDRLKADERTSHIPIILLTAKADQNSRVEGLKKGADAYLAKPFDKKELLVRLNKLIELRKKLQKRYEGFGAIPIKRDQTFQQEDDFLEKVKQIIEGNLDNEDFDVKQLYRAVGVSRIQLYRKLKALTDLSPAQIIQHIRLYHARQLLSSSNLSIGEVASRTGFKDQSYFTKKYKEAFNELPSQTSNP